MSSGFESRFSFCGRRVSIGVDQISLTFTECWDDLHGDGRDGGQEERGAIRARPCQTLGIRYSSVTIVRIACRSDTLDQA